MISLVPTSMLLVFEINCIIFLFKVHIDEKNLPVFIINFYMVNIDVADELNMKGI